MENGIMPVIYYCNPNIYPIGEYELRRSENIRHAKSLGIGFVEAEYDHELWLNRTGEMKSEPERGGRCLVCFKLRMAETAGYASENGFKIFTTSLASSRWKDIRQIVEAGRYAASLYPGVGFWEQDWRKHGLTERKNYLTKAYGFYRQQYCGCEFSMRGK